MTNDEFFTTYLKSIKIDSLAQVIKVIKVSFKI